jgi:hypothetical protein
LGAAGAEGCSRSRGKERNDCFATLLCGFRDRRSSRFRYCSYSNRPERSACSQTALVGVLRPLASVAGKNLHILSET